MNYVLFTTIIVVIFALVGARKCFFYLFFRLLIAYYTMNCSFHKQFAVFSLKRLNRPFPFRSNLKWNKNIKCKKGKYSTIIIHDEWNSPKKGKIMLKLNILKMWNWQCLNRTCNMNLKSTWNWQSASFDIQKCKTLKWHKNPNHVHQIVRKSQCFSFHPFHSVGCQSKKLFIVKQREVIPFASKFQIEREKDEKWFHVCIQDNHRAFFWDWN